MKAKKLLNMDAETHCTRCKTPFENFSGHRIGVNIQKGGCAEVICPACDEDEGIWEYKKTGEMTSRLVVQAVLAKCAFGYKDGLSNLRRTTAAFYEQQKETLLEIAAKNDQITERAREWELKHWFGGLQKMYKDSPARGHSGHNRVCKVLLWGCAGRVMVTISDRYNKDNKKSKFGGAWISLIFDEDSPTARGGVQGYCATLEEALGLLDASSKDLPALKPDKKVTMLGV